MNSRIQQIEAFVRQTMNAVTNSDLKIGHDLKHVQRVRRSALQIAAGEGYTHLACVEAAALLHDIGLASVTDRSRHGEVGAEMAARFLQEQAMFTTPEIAEIVKAIRDHCVIQVERTPLGHILHDADILDMLGAVGLMRAFTSKYAMQEYDPDTIRGETWGLTADAFTTRRRAGLGIGTTIMDQINLQIAVFDDLHTVTARQIAGPRVEFMRAFAGQLVEEIAG